MKLSPFSLFTTLEATVGGLCRLKYGDRAKHTLFSSTNLSLLELLDWHIICVFPHNRIRYFPDLYQIVLRCAA